MERGGASLYDVCGNHRRCEMPVFSLRTRLLIALSALVVLGAAALALAEAPAGPAWRNTVEVLMIGVVAGAAMDLLFTAVARRRPG